MNTFWLKIAAFAVVVVVAIFLISYFLPPKSTEEPEKTFYDMVEKDQEKFSAPPSAPEQLIEKPSEEPVKGQVQEQNQPPPPDQITIQPVQPPETKPPVQPAQLYFKPLSEIDKIEAERLLDVAVSGRSLGRLPKTGFQLMVEPCRQIISKWPDSWYAYNAKKMLIDMPVRFRDRYRITPEELDISEFTKHRPGTEPFNGADTVEEESF